MDFNTGSGNSVVIVLIVKRIAEIPVEGVSPCLLTFRRLGRRVRGYSFVVLGWCLRRVLRSWFLVEEESTVASFQYSVGREGTWGRGWQQSVVRRQRFEKRKTSAGALSG